MTQTRRSRPTLLSLGSLQRTDAARLSAEDRAGLESFLQGILRRWLLLAVVTVFNVTAQVLGLVAASALVVWGALVVFGLLNFILSSIPRGSGYHPFYPHVSVLFDLAVLATPIAFTGLVGLSPFLILGVLPYATRSTGRIRLIHSGLGAGAVFGALATYAYLNPEARISIFSSAHVLVAAAVGITAYIVRWREAGRLERIDNIRDVTNKAAEGALFHRLPDEGSDEIGQMTEAINMMLVSVTRTVADVQREAREVAAFAEMLSLSAQGVLGSTQSVLDTAQNLAGEMDTQRERAEDGQDRTADAAAAASSLRDRADRMASGVQRLLSEAQAGRERVQRASETLIAIAEDVNRTAATVQDLSSMSNDIGNFVHTTSRIARQTHVLALNAAIEAAHSGAGNEGFSAVADEVRSLAATSAESARNAADIIESVRGHIVSVARSMGAGEIQVRDVGAVAGEAKDALDALVRGASEVSELVRVTADISRSQANRMTDLAEQMAEIANVNARTSIDAQGAAEAMGNQRVTLEDLHTIATQLASLADRLAQSVDRFAIKRADQTTGDLEAELAKTLGE